MTEKTLAPLRALRYGPLRRWADTHDGRADARADVPGSTRPTAWLQRNAHTFAERAATARIHREEELHDALRRHRTVVARIHGLEDRLIEIEREIDAAAPTESELSRRAPTEGALSEAAVRARRMGEASRRCAHLHAQRRQCAGELRDLRQEQSGLVGRLGQGWQRVVRRVEQLQRFHSRRQETYRRAYLRRLVKQRELEPDDAVLSVAEIDMPSWATDHCPWLESEVHAAAAGLPTSAAA